MNISLPSPARPDVSQAPAFLRVHSTGYFHRMHRHHLMRARSVDYLIMWVLAGEGFVHSEGVQYAAGAGDLIALDKGPPQEYGAVKSNPWSIIWAHYDGDAASDFFTRMRHGPVMAGKAMGHLGLHTPISQLFHDMVTAARTAPARNAHLCSCLLAGVLGMMIHQMESPAVSAVDGQSRDLSALLGWIDQHLQQRLTAEDLATRCKVSVRQLSRLFHEQLGESPLRYVAGQRVAKAALLLSQTDMPIKQIGQAVGCDDPYYFSRLFSQHAGQSPQAYRKAHRSG